MLRKITGYHQDEGAIGSPGFCDSADQPRFQA